MKLLQILRVHLCVVLVYENDLVVGLDNLSVRKINKPVRLQLRLAVLPK